NVGIGTTTPSSLLSVGSTSQFQVNSSGAIASATGITSSGTIRFSGFTSNGGPLYTNASGVLAQVTAGTSTQVLHGGTTPTFGAVSLTTDISGILPVANGGTNTSTIGGAGSIPYSTGTAYGFSAVGTAGQALISGGTGAPTFYTPTAGSLLFAGTSGSLQQDNANLFWDDTNNRLGIGTTTPSALLSVGSTSQFQVNSSGAIASVTNITASGQLNASDGVVTKVTAGTCDDTAFTLDTDGNICIDSTNGRIYYRYGGGWHYSAQTAGFQIPNYEAYSYDFTKQAFDTDRALASGDFLIPFVENFVSDGAVHGLYTRFSDVKDTLFADEHAQIQEISLKTNQNITTLSALQESVDAQLSVAGTELSTLIAQNTLYEERFTDTDKRLNDIDDMTAKMRADIDHHTSQIELLQQQVQTLTDFYTTFDLSSVLAQTATTTNVDVLPQLADLETRVIHLENTQTTPQVNPLAGEAIIQSGTSVVTILSPSVDKDSFIFVTPEDVAIPLAVTAKKPGESFDVIMTEIATKDIHFSWWIVTNTQVNTQTTSQNPE
ncbi:MAG: hypothetical protein ACSLEX_00005, partial [Minisyncoccota bacterium]